MQIFLLDEQSSLVIDKDLIEKQVVSILKKEAIKTDELILHFVDKKTIKKLHKKFFNDPTITDCISILIDDASSIETHHILGEIFVCTDVAIDYAKKNNIDPLFENSYYIIHGILHLIGFDDIDIKDREIMRKKEKEIINYLKTKKLM
jgi:probable rRNA maturation factor